MYCIYTRTITMIRIAITLFVTLNFDYGMLPKVFADEYPKSAFIQTGDELHYFVDSNQWSEGILAHVFVENIEMPRKYEKGTNKKKDRKSTLLAQLKFEPTVLEFNARDIGVPELRKVRVFNSGTASVKFEAVSGSTMHFHCSFFEHKTVEAGSSTTFDVVFLPRQEGRIDNTLYVHSSAGTFSLGVSGVGTPNPYRLRPFVGAKVPLNGSIIENVDIYNPHSTTLKITEIFSSGGDLHLELPDGSSSATTAIWEIPPYKTKTVMKARFVGSQERNATAYIRIKTNRSDELPLLVPIEVEVLSKPGLYVDQDRLDFGIVTGNDLSKWLTLNVYNTLNRTIQITGIEVDVEAVKVNFTPVSIKPNTRKSSFIAKLAYHGAEHTTSSFSSKATGIVKLKSQDPEYNLQVPYDVQVLQGKVYHNNGETQFECCGVKTEKRVTHEISLMSTYESNLAVYDVSLSAKARQLFRVSRFDAPVVIAKTNRTVVCSLELTMNKFDETMRAMDLTLLIHTNVSKFSVPLKIYNGKLRSTLYSIDQTAFDFGSMDFSQERMIMFALTNENAVSVNVANLGAEGLPEHTIIDLLGVEAGNHSVLAFNHSPLKFNWKQGENFTLFPNTFAVFRYAVKAPSEKSSYEGWLNFRTNYESVTFPVRYTVTEGSLVSLPGKIIISDAFPGKISSHALRVYNTYLKEMHVLRLSTTSNDPRFIFESFEDGKSPLIKVKEASQIGRIYFVPLATCMYDCYVGMPLNTDDGYDWIRGMKLPPDLPEVDYELYYKLKSKWNLMVAKGEHIANNTVMVDSTQVKSFPIPVEAHLSWPRLMKNPAVHFPLTAVGNYTIVNLTLHNPSSLPVAVQMLPLTIYPNPEDLIRLFRNELDDSPLTDHVEMDDVLMFSLRDSELYNARRESPVPMFRHALEQALNTHIPRFTLSLLLQPGMKVRIRLGFLPSDYDLRSSLLLIRNNLTVLEMVTLYGRGAKMELRIANRPPQTSMPLIFEIQDKHLTECENIKRLQHKLPTSLTLRRSFTAKNTGELPLTVTNLTISGVNCQNRGFRVLNCEPFTLKPNETHELEIAFTPDFTLSWYDASLQLYLGGMHAPMVYGIGATIPREWLPKCLAALPRPYWESLMYYSCVIALGFLFVCVIASAYLEGDRIITCALRRHFDVQFRKIFTLHPSKQTVVVSTSNGDKISAIGSNANETPILEHLSLFTRLVKLMISLLKERKLTRMGLHCGEDIAQQIAQTRNQKNVTDSGQISKNVAKGAKVSKIEDAAGKTTANGHKKQKLPRLNRRQAVVQKSIELESEIDDSKNVAVSDNEIVAISVANLRETPRKMADEIDIVPPNDDTVFVKHKSAFKTLKANKRNETRKLKNNEIVETDGSDVRSGKHELPMANEDLAVNEIGSESDDHGVPEWDSASLPNSDVQNIDEAFDQIMSQTEQFTATLSSGEAKTGSKRQKRPNQANNVAAWLPSAADEADVDEARMLHNNWSSLSSIENSDSSGGDIHRNNRENVTVEKMHVKNSPLKPTTFNLVLKSPVMAKHRTVPKTHKNYEHMLTSNVHKPPTQNQIPNTKQPAEFALPHSAWARPLHQHAQPSRPTVTAAAYSTQHSLMQQLRRERLQRLHAYKAQGQSGEEEWPGFDMNPVLTNLWDEECDPTKQAEFSESIWGYGYSARDSIWAATDSDATPLAEAPRLFDLAAAFGARGAATGGVAQQRGWSPSRSAPFGAESSVEQQLRRHSATLSHSPAPTPPPPNDPSVLAWGPTQAKEVDGNAGQNIWAPTPRNAKDRQTWSLRMLD